MKTLIYWIQFESGIVRYDRHGVDFVNLVYNETTHVYNLSIIFAPPSTIYAEHFDILGKLIKFELVEEE